MIVNTWLVVVHTWLVIVSAWLGSRALQLNTWPVAASQPAGRPAWPDWSVAASQPSGQPAWPAGQAAKSVQATPGCVFVLLALRKS